MERFHAEGYTVSTALAPKTSAAQQGPWGVAHDYKAHGEIVDFVLLMTYEWGYSAGPPMAVSPLPEVEAVVKYAVSEIPANKVLLGRTYMVMTGHCLLHKEVQLQRQLAHKGPLK